MMRSTIPDNVSQGTRVSSFADDTRASRGMKTFLDPGQLQHDIETIYKWATEVNMEFNGDKFECIRYWPDEDLGAVFKEEFKYTNEEGKTIEEKEDIKDLGILLSNDLSFGKHIDKVESSCTKIVGWALRTFRTRSTNTMLVIWNSLIQSRLDYCSQLWSPSKASEIAKIEDVQRHFTRKIDGMNQLTYRQRLKKLHMYSQERRRDRYMVIFIWKIAMGLVKGYKLDFINEGTRRGRECVVADIVRNSPVTVRRARENSLSVKGAKMFNLLPPYLRNVTSDRVGHFKSKLDAFLKEIPDQPTSTEEGRVAETNCLLHQLPLANLNLNRL